MPLKDTFARHLHDVWTPFAKTVIDHFLQFGFVVVSLEEEAPPPFANFIRGKQMAAQSEMGPEANTLRNTPRDPPDAAEARAAKRPIATDADQSRQRTPKRPAAASAAQARQPRPRRARRRPVRALLRVRGRVQLPPAVPHLQHQLRLGLQARLLVRGLLPAASPTPGGNVCSPIATVFQSASFISALEELALQAEVVRARQMLVTQPITRTQGSQNLDPANLFFDSESRAVQASATAEDDAAQAGSLALQAQMMQHDQPAPDDQPRPQPPRRRHSAVPSHVPPPLPPQLFACPGKAPLP